jgi:hypothetical protein
MIGRYDAALIVVRTRRNENSSAPRRGARLPGIG